MDRDRLSATEWNQPSEIHEIRNKGKKMNKYTLAAVGGLLLALLISSTAIAETCKIKDYRWTKIKGNIAKIEGETTCREGILYIRQYWMWRSKEIFAGTAMAMINGYTFTALFDTMHSRPSDDKDSATLAIRYDYKRGLFD